ncbi:BTB/POZ domain-containing protein KCTD6-like [Strongylocentrotus purpuratus]|uniref:Potassium channel tetramerisation-type BTB domain-containing protein n=1 Tax=Strongylocentrotus purpuratus TaxID=7668 RepID=A0A7M7GFB4_STRPU|nr:BTB/POZ domain-containing protein KCTD6-like [Strongylocentrotus purpuratus]|eukprot:XP_003723300.1 PREDICTED: BTB/POZ domain-containing protein KCTD6-like [Strongylocentrotus purpuratus]
MLWSMFSDRLPSIKDDKGNYLIDGDGPLFRYVLNFLRRSILVLPEDFKELDMLAQEADYYQIKELIDAVARAKSAHFKEQEVLEVERLNGHYWSIHSSSEILEKIPIVMEAWDRRGYVKRSSVDPIFGPEEGGFSFASGTSLSRIKLFRQITQLGFKLISACPGDSVDRWVFTRGGGTCTTPTKAT